MRLALAAVALIVLVIVIRPYRRRETLVMSIALISLLFPRPIPYLGLPAQVEPYAGIAPGVITPYAALLGMLILLFTLPTRGGEAIRPVAIIVWLATLIFFALFAWEGNQAQWSGVLTWTTAGLAWLAGSRAGWLWSRDPKIARLLSTGVVLFLILQLAVCCLQYAGVLQIANTDQGLARARGTFGHAGDLGKIVVASAALLLPTFSRNSTVSQRRLTFIGIGCSFGIVALSASRANLLAIFLLVLVWILQARSRDEKKAGSTLLVTGFLACLPFSSIFLLRFREDPTGGSRPELMDAAFQQLARDPWLGTGPNSYVQVVGLFDPVTARGLPVHNLLLLVPAELGFPLAVLIMISTLHVVQRVLRAKNVEGSRPYAATTVAYFSSLFIIAITGWGGIKITVFPFLVFTGALLAGAALSKAKEDESASASVHAGKESRNAAGKR